MWSNLANGKYRMKSAKYVEDGPSGLSMVLHFPTFSGYGGLNGLLPIGETIRPSRGLGGMISRPPRIAVDRLPFRKKPEANACPKQRTKCPMVLRAISLAFAVIPQRRSRLGGGQDMPA